MKGENRSLRLVRICGALAEVQPLAGAALNELVRVGQRRLPAEVIRIHGETATVQIYDDTTGLAVGDPVEPTGGALSIDLGPGLLGTVLDGVGRPLERVAAATGDWLAPGAEAPALDPGRRWRLVPARRAGDVVGPGDVLGTVEERPGFLHRILVPPRGGGRIEAIASGDFAPFEPFGRLAGGAPLTLAQRWPVREPRPLARRLPFDRPFLTGQRVLDLLFPAAEGGTVALPGGFGTGKTIIEQSLARHCDADIVVYVGCGERGNEMAEVLEELPRLEDPRTGRPLMERTVLVVNTSNMPVAAREASVQLGVAIAEYFRDQGLRVALLADSLSRWAEALREIGARLQEMPGEEGYPTELASRMARLFERAGRGIALGAPEREGAVTFVAAISPPGGDLSEPVTQAALRVAGTLWSLDAGLAHQRQFPAVDPETSFSLAAPAVEPWLARSASPEWGEIRARALALLARERELSEIAALIGLEALQDRDRLTLEAARAFRSSVLGQSAADPDDARSSLEKTACLARLALAFESRGQLAIASGHRFEALAVAPVRAALAALRGSPASQLEARARAVTAALDALAVGAAR